MTKASNASWKEISRACRDPAVEGRLLLIAATLTLAAGLLRVGYTFQQGDLELLPLVSTALIGLASAFFAYQGLAKTATPARPEPTLISLLLVVFIVACMTAGLGAVLAAFAY